MNYLPFGYMLKKNDLDSYTFHMKKMSDKNFFVWTLKEKTEEEKLWNNKRKLIIYNLFTRLSYH